MKVHHEVTDINAVKKTVTVYNLDTGKVYEESYDKLILSPGAKPIKPNLPGIDNDKIFTLRTVGRYIENTKLCRRKETQNCSYGWWWIYRT